MQIATPSPPNVPPLTARNGKRRKAVLLEATLLFCPKTAISYVTASMTAAYKWSPAVRLQRRLRTMVRLCVGAGTIAVRPDAEKESLNEKGMPNGMV